MKKAYDEFNGILKAFRQARALKYEKKYNREHNAAQKNAYFAELYDKVETALGATGSHLLSDYTDSVIELYNTDVDYFYDRGFDDCQQIYSKLTNIAPLSSVDNNGDEDEDDDGDDPWLDLKTDKLDGLEPDGTADKTETADSVL